MSKKVKICRDCVECTESTAKAAAMWGVRKTGTLAGGFAVNVFRRKCPQCGHFMLAHKTKDGFFRD
jgi:hypothetical protein